MGDVPSIQKPMFNRRVPTLEDISRPEKPIISRWVPTLEDISPPYKDWRTCMQQQTDVVWLTVKNDEFLNCYPYLENVYKSNRKSIGMVYFGEIKTECEEKVKIALVRSNEGAGTAQGAQNVATNAVRILKPKAIICVGFCGGLNGERAKIGDVVISRRLSTYAPKKITANGREESRGVTANVSRNMGDLIRTAAHGWKAPFKTADVDNAAAFKVVVHTDKEMLSGPELVDDGATRTKLLEKFPNAVGIEMEGEGIYAAAYNLEVEWLVVKGISDYADGTKSDTKEWRSFASAMAASVVHHMLKQPQALKDWPYYFENAVDDP